MTRRPNILVLMSDEHARKVMGVYGDKVVHTPNLDRLSAESVVFDNAYTPSPICVPARAALATGRDIHEIGCWDNAHPYEGNPTSWAHTLRDAGFKVESIGKLHYRNAALDTGFTSQTLPMHVANGIGDLSGSIRNPPELRPGSRKLAEKLGPGDTDYIQYDHAVRDAAIARLQQAANNQEDGLILFVSFVAPHFPLIAPKAFYDLYADRPMLPQNSQIDDNASHPWLTTLRKSYAYDNFDEARRQEALRSYYGLVSFLDDNIGQILNTLNSTSRAERTSIIYLSDHGDNLGEHGMWGKSTFFEESVGVPLLIRPAGGKAPGRCQTPVSLTDLYPTILDLAGLPPETWFRNSVSVLKIAGEPYDPDRTVLSQYHAAGSPSGAFMIRQGAYKYIYYEGYPPQLFDLSTDPMELNDLAGESDSAEILSKLHGLLISRLDPARESAKAFSDQKALIMRHGGSEAVMSSNRTFTATPAPQLDT